mmetsp:Transcript_21628/g.24139  ORF Transcript_21628/g.24139 Transcript_21628/m.24139 type:complete len:325 (+) Transcript_21628:27-1001(+)
MAEIEASSGRKSKKSRKDKKRSKHKKAKSGANHSDEEIHYTKRRKNRMTQAFKTTRARKAKSLKIPSLAVTAGGYIIPDPEKGDEGCEDAYFISKDHKCIAVFDGLGDEQLIHSRQYALALVEAVGKAYEGGNKDPLSLLEIAYDYAQGKKYLGGSTATVAVVGPGQVNMAYLGDSQIAVLRPKDRWIETMFVSHGQEWYFNAPYQINSINREMTPRTHAAQASVPVLPDDIILIGSDGLWDNISEDDIFQKLLRSYISEPRAPGKIAKYLADEAYRVVRTAKRKNATPFGKRFAQVMKQSWKGGKVDDITVVVALLKHSKYDY